MWHVLYWTAKLLVWLVTSKKKADLQKGFIIPEKLKEKINQNGLKGNKVLNCDDKAVILCEIGAQRMAAKFMQCQLDAEY